MSSDNKYDPHNPNYNQPEDDDYGLPEAEYDPIARPQPVEEEPVAATPPPPRREIEVKKKDSSSAGLWITLIILLALVGVAVWLFLFNDPEPAEQPIAEQPKVEQPVEPEPEPITYEEPVEESPDAWENNTAQGSLSTISSPTGGYHIIVGSFIDSDMAYDYGKKLEAEGMKASVIEPSGDRKFYRLAVSSGNFTDLNTKLPELKSRYGDNIWIVKY
jgi:hypothetical protein